MKVWLDDERPAPLGWVHVRSVDAMHTLIRPFGGEARVTEISLDHDLGDGERDGYDVLLFIERLVHEVGFRPPIIHIHTANPPARKRMEAAVAAIARSQGVKASC